MKCIVWTVKYWRHHQNMTKIGQIFESKSFSIICLVHKHRRASNPHIYLPLFVSLFQHRWADPSPPSLPSYISVSLFFLFCCITAIQQVYFPLVKTFTPPRHDFVLQKWQKKKNPVDNCATIHFWWPIKMTDAIILQDPRIYSFRIPLMR